MASYAITLLISIPLLLLPPGVCPCDLLGLECHKESAPEPDHDSGDHDCDCVKVKVLGSPPEVQDHLDSAAFAFALPMDLSSLPVIASAAEPLPNPFLPPSPPLYLMLRAFRC